MTLSERVAQLEQQARNGAPVDQALECIGRFLAKAEGRIERTYLHRPEISSAARQVVGSVELPDKRGGWGEAPRQGCASPRGAPPGL